MVGERKNMARISNWILILSILICILLSEYILVYHDVTYGIIFVLCTATGIYLLISVKEMNAKVADSAESLALVLICILLTSSLPWFFLNQAYLLPCVYAAIMGICFYHVHQKKLGFEELGFKKQRFVEYSLIGILIAVTFGTIEFVILKPALTFSAFETGNLLMNLVYMVLFVGVGEELLFRGVIQRDLTHAFGPAAGLVLASSVFCVMHLVGRSISELALVFSMGIIFGYLYYKTGSLTAPIVAHGVGNVMLVGVFPYLRPSSYVLMVITIIVVLLLLYYKIGRKLEERHILRVWRVRHAKAR